MIHAAKFNAQFEAIKIMDGDVEFLDLNTGPGESWRPIAPEITLLEDVPPYGELSEHQG